jgi:DNA-binding transcriptional regulator YiaG
MSMATDELDTTNRGPTIAPETIRAMIEETGLSQREWAQSVAGRSPRTIRKWLAGEPIPADASDWLQRILSVEVRPTQIVVKVAR